MDMAGLICQTARAHPAKQALVDEQCAYTFEEFDSLSTRFAQLLRARGVRTGDRIAFCSPKTATLAVAIVGCLKAGAVYVPVDSRLPKDRLLFILNDVAPQAIVSSQGLYDPVAADLHAPSILIESDLLAGYLRQGGGNDVELPRIAARDVAYCIYTSGSTGRPKGVLIEHGSVDVFFSGLADVMQIDESCRCLNTSELYFDVHVMDLFFPLHRGATVHLSHGPMIANKLLQTISAQRITHFTAVAPLMTLMTEGTLFESCDLSSVIRVMTGAEIINVNTMQKWLRKVPGLSLVNGYGPTEATVICTAYIIDQVEPNRVDFYPIGQPLRGTQVLLLEHDQVVSEPFVKGELLIGGPQVMKGYWNDPGQTQDKIRTISGTRYYRSGDVCQWLPDGNLDYVGRTDEQIKLSGFRIDLSEVKRVMDAIPSVREAQPVVAVHPALGKVIAACFTRDSTPALDDDGAFSFLQSVFKEQLPYYMVPSLYFLFEEFPKLPSGKTDKKRILNRVNDYISHPDTGLTRFVCRETAAVS
jgi:amino acid adenylation domain-containing protein